ncbi:MAG: DUF805 domain-containing protein [Thermomicrobiales bacterium]
MSVWRYCCLRLPSSYAACTIPTARGWWYFLVIIPIIGWLVLLFFLISAGTPGPNRFGPPPVA